MTRVFLYPRGFGNAKKEAEREIQHSFGFQERTTERIHALSLEKISKKCPDITGVYSHDAATIEVRQHAPNKIIEAYIAGQQTTYGFGHVQKYFRDEFTPEEAYVICSDLGRFCKQGKKPLLTQLEVLVIKTSQGKSTEYMALDTLHQYVTNIDLLHELDAYTEAGELQFILLKKRFSQTIYGQLLSSSEHSVVHEQNRVHIIFKKNDNKPHAGLLHVHVAQGQKPITRQERGALAHIITLLNSMNVAPDNPTYRAQHVVLKYTPARV